MWYQLVGTRCTRLIMFYLKQVGREEGMVTAVMHIIGNNSIEMYVLYHHSTCITRFYIRYSALRVRLHLYT